MKGLLFMQGDIVSSNREKLQYQELETTWQSIHGHYVLESKTTKEYQELNNMYSLYTVMM